ncbi:MAG: polyketide cyclase [Actinobacteria bacterium]|nr:MAG: polyketide cyclase [Actinomycetota bacterium]
MATQQQTASGSVGQDFVEDFVARWLAAWNSHQAEQVLGMMGEDVVYDDSAWPRTMHGHADVREFLAHSWRAFPDMRFELADGPFLHPSEPRAAFHWRGDATHLGPIDPPGLAPTGKKLGFQGADFHEYSDGKLARLRIVFDVAHSMRQLGALPPPGSPGERLSTRLVNLQNRLRRK